MRVRVNGALSDTSCKTIGDLRDSNHSGCGILIVNGYGVSPECPISDGDEIFITDKDWKPDEGAFDSLMSARDSPGVHGILKNSVVGIAGVGGLGSNIASMLARSGIGRIVIADHDTVDVTNLNRQNYFIGHLGMKKTEATASIISEINPFVTVESHCIRLTEENAVDVFRGCDVVCEALDGAERKAMLVNSLLEGDPDIRIVSGSGMAGYGDSNRIKTERRFDRLTVCGDGTEEARIGNGLMAPRVGICAGHMANAVIDILLTENQKDE